MRVAADGYIDLSDGRRVRTPGYHDHAVDPVPPLRCRCVARAMTGVIPPHVARLLGHRRECRRISIGRKCAAELQAGP